MPADAATPIWTGGSSAEREPLQIDLGDCSVAKGLARYSVVEERKRSPAGGGVNPFSPAFKASQEPCQSVMPGPVRPARAQADPSPPQPTRKV